MAASGRWAIRMPLRTNPMFYFITQGRCWFQSNNGELVELQEGDYVLSARPIADVFFSEPGVGAVLSEGGAFSRRRPEARRSYGGTRDAGLWWSYRLQRGEC
jgi:hypothetical protein